MTDNYNHGCVGWTNYTTMLLQCIAIKKEQKQVSIKRFLKRNLADVGMSQWMHWLTKYTNKKCHAHSGMHSIIIMGTLFNNHPYISSSGWPVGNKFSATYIGMHGCWIMWPCACGHFLFVYFVSQCIHWDIPTSARFLFRNLYTLKLTHALMNGIQQLRIAHWLLQSSLKKHKS